MYVQHPQECLCHIPSQTPILRTVCAARRHPIALPPPIGFRSGGPTRVGCRSRAESPRGDWSSSIRRFARRARTGMSEPASARIRHRRPRRTKDGPAPGDRKFRTPACTRRWAGISEVRWSQVKMLYPWLRRLAPSAPWRAVPSGDPRPVQGSQPGPAE